MSKNYFLSICALDDSEGIFCWVWLFEALFEFLNLEDEAGSASSEG